MPVQISTLVDELSVLPEQGSATMRLLGLLDDPEAGSREIVPILEADPAMTARLLTLANSAFFGLKQSASNVWSAVVVVGFNVVRALATTGGLGLGDNQPGSMPPGYWQHSIATGASASAVAKRMGVRASDAFSAGLLHDVGAALLYRAARERYDEAVVAGPAGPRTSLAKEVEVFGAGHDAVGGVVLEHLYFPESMVAAVRDQNVDPTRVATPLSRAVIAGMSLAEAAGYPSSTEPAPEPAVALQAAGLGTEPDDELNAEIAAEIANLNALLG